MNLLEDDDDDNREPGELGEFPVMLGLISFSSNLSVGEDLFDEELEIETVFIGGVFKIVLSLISSSKGSFIKFEIEVVGKCGDVTAERGTDIEGMLATDL